MPWSHWQPWHGSTTTTKKKEQDVDLMEHQDEEDFQSRIRILREDLNLTRLERNVAIQIDRLKAERDAACRGAGTTAHRLDGLGRLQVKEKKVKPIIDDDPFAPPGVHQATSMSLRDWFAGQALSGLCGNTTCSGSMSAYAEDAYRFADAMLAERAKRSEYR